MPMNTSAYQEPLEGSVSKRTARMEAELPLTWKEIEVTPKQAAPELVGRKVTRA